MYWITIIWFMFSSTCGTWVLFLLKIHSFPVKTIFHIFISYIYTKLLPSVVRCHLGEKGRVGTSVCLLPTALN